MAQVTLMAGIVSLHGKLGEYCYRTCKNGKVILSRMPTKSNKPITDAQKKHRERFSSVVRKVNEILKDPTQREVMEKMYKKSAISTVNPDLHIPINRIQNDLSNLQNKVLKQNERNRILLKSHMIQLKQQINEYKNPYRNLTSVYFTKSNPGSRITIEI